MLIVTHEMRFAEKVSDRIFFVNEGVIYEEGTPHDIFHKPQKPATKVFINRLKTFTKTFYNEKIDLAKAQSEIEEFTHNQFMSFRYSMRLQLAFEELVYEMLIKRRKNIFPVKLIMMYNETLEKCEIRISYGGEKYNPFENITDDYIIPLKIINGMIEDKNFDFDGENILTINVK